MVWSQAWHKALKRRAEVQKLLELARSQSDKLEKDRHISDQEACLRLYMVALIAHLQAYIADLLNELCDELPDAWSDAMPLFQKKYILLQVRQKLHDMITERDENSLVTDDNIERHRKQLFKAATWLEHPVEIAAYGRKDFRGFLKDNGSSAIDKAISQFRGDKLKFSDWLGRDHPRYNDIFSLIDNAIMVRNDAAHGKSEQRITLYEARIYTVAIYRFILKADEFLAPPL